MAINRVNPEEIFVPSESEYGIEDFDHEHQLLAGGTMSTLRW
jgi:hypothetical protein